MGHNVDLSRRAQEDIESAYLYIREDSPGRAARWRQRLLAMIDSLEHFPLRHALAPEAEAIEMKVRQMMFGTYRVIYAVEVDTVNVTRRAARGTKAAQARRIERRGMRPHLAQTLDP